MNSIESAAFKGRRMLSQAAKEETVYNNLKDSKTDEQQRVYQQFVCFSQFRMRLAGICSATTFESFR